MRQFALVLVVAAWAGHALAMEDADGSVAKLSAADQAALEKALDISLFDGKSARVRDVRVTDKRRACGWVNAKGLSGGYTGYRMFAADLGDGSASFVKRQSFGAVSDLDEGLSDEERAVCISTKHLTK